MGDSRQKVLAKASRRPRVTVPPVRCRPKSTHAESSATLLQPTLKVGAANDPLEREAENMADRVVAMPAPTSQDAAEAPPRPAPANVTPLRRDSVEDQPSTETLETTPPIPADHQDPEVPPAEDVDTRELSAEDMKEIESGEPEDTSGEPPADEAEPTPADEQKAQPARSDDSAVVGAEGGAAPDDVARHVSQPGSGRALPASVRGFMEPRFDKDFSDVRVHDAPDDREAAARIGARAFTHREHIWLGPGESVENRRLMAHELTHVVQQTKRSPAPDLNRDASATDDSEDPAVRRGYLRNKAEKYARKVPGYRLVSVILGKSPITGKIVERNATNLIGAFLALIPGGGELFDRLMESRVLQEAFDWVKARLHALKITWTRIKNLIAELIDYLPARPSNVIKKAKQLFGPLLRDIMRFIKDVVAKVLEFIIRGALRLAGPWGEKVWAVIKRAGGVIMKILKDPLGFAKNLFRAVIRGFKQFKSKVGTYLKKGLLGWLFGTIKGLDLKLPSKLDFKGLLSVGLQIVGLTYAKFRALLVKRLGANGERKVSFIEKSVEVVKVLVKQGFVGMWQRVVQMIDGFTQTIIGGIQKFVVESLIKGGLSWLAGLTNPAGAIVKVAMAIYKMIKTFLERINQIIEVAESIFSSIGAIAAGKIQQAADYIERTIASSIPVVISFLAALVPVSGITASIRNIIKRLQQPVARAMDKMITFLVKKAKKLFAKIISKLNRKRKLPSVNFKVGKTPHRMYGEKKGRKVQVMVASCEGKPIEEVEAATAEEATKMKSETASKTAASIAAATGNAQETTEKPEQQIDLESTNQNQKKQTAELQAAEEEGAKNIADAAIPAEKEAEIDTEDGCSGPLFRFREPRSAEVEGQVETYRELRKKVGEAETATGRKPGSVYEVDHIIEKQIPKAILENLRKLDPTKSTRASIKPFRTADRKATESPSVANKQTKSAASFGQIGSNARSKIGDDAADFPAIILYRPNHRDKDSVKPAEVHGWIQDASETKDPHMTLKGQIQKQLNTETKNVATVYQGDKDADDAISEKVKAGLEAMQSKNASIYGLDENAAPVPDLNEKSADARSKSQLEFSPDDGPNFDDIEGRYESYTALPDGFGQYLEKDHIVEKSYALQAKALTLGDDSIWPQIADVDLDEEGGPSDKELARRRKRLKNEPLFTGAGLRAYTADAGKAMLMYRPIHREVSRTHKGASSMADLGADASDPTVEKTAKAFLMTGDDSQIDAIRSAIKPSVRKTVDEATKRHISAVETEYNDEIQNVKDANSEEAQARAVAAMQAIIGKVKTNLTEARRLSSSLFN